jgi:hypothetical protein
MLDLDAAGNILYKVKDYKLHIGEVSSYIPYNWWV